MWVSDIGLLIQTRIKVQLKTKLKKKCSYVYLVWAVRGILVLRLFVCPIVIIYQVVGTARISEITSELKSPFMSLLSCHKTKLVHWFKWDKCFYFLIKGQTFKDTQYKKCNGHQEEYLSCETLFSTKSSIPKCIVSPTQSSEVSVIHAYILTLSTCKCCNLVQIYIS